ncbi:MAG: hypothetical protein QM758_03220 [Armatimonas sp.]
MSIPIALVANFVITRSRKYSRLFNEATFEEFYERLTEAIRAAVRTQGDPSVENFIENGTAFRLSADIAASVTFAQRKDGFILHIALSQPDHFVTTHSVATHFGFFILAMLNKNRAEMTPFYTPSSVHHIVLKLESADIVFNSFEESYREYRENYQPFRFEAEDEPQPIGE